VDGLVKELRREGFEGDALFAAVEERLIETYGPEAAEMVESYRLFEQEIARVDLEAMSPEEHFEYLRRVRRDVFGEEMADALFFEKEAFSRYKLEESAIREDESLTEEEQRAGIMARRNALQVELASRGAYVSFADERRDELEGKLREKYGDGLESMSAEERQAATRELYREELPPETLEKVERVLASQARKRAAFQAYQEESQAILNDPELSFEQRQEQLLELSERYNSGGF
jgi:lipase chaperone LimK